jgi:hypothetical protein
MFRRSKRLAERRRMREAKEEEAVAPDALSKVMEEMLDALVWDFVNGE